MNEEKYQEDIVTATKNNIYQYGLATFQRAFADINDGLKPVNRRIMYLMHEEGIRHNEKVGKIGGAVMKYHPHGDTSINDAIVKLGQWFTTNYPLIHTQGNFGALSGDPPAAARYIEASPSDFARDVLLDDIDDFSVDYKLNYDFKYKEPVRLPSKLPLVLIQGSYGIGEAFSASVPSHNLHEIIERLIKYIKNPDITNSVLCEDLYPDYPTGGEIVNGLEVKAYYTKGVKCTVRIRGKCEVDDVDKKIIVRELPYGVTFNLIQEAIQADRLKYKAESVFDGILRADKDNSIGCFVVECKKDSNPHNILLELYKKSKLEFSRPLNFMVNVDSFVKNVTVKEIFESWFRFRQVTKQRKLTYEMNTIRNRTHVLEGVYLCYDIMDDVIKVIRNSGDKNDVIEKLTKSFDLTLVQAKGIAEMQVASLSKYSKEELRKTIEFNKKKIDDMVYELLHLEEVIISELEYIDKKYGRPRRTVVNLNISSSIGSPSNEVEGESGISNGLLLYSNHHVGLFEQTFLLNGKKINQGLPRQHEVLGGHPIGQMFKGFVVFFSDETAKYVEAKELPSLHVWKQVQEGKIFITSIAPIVGKPEEIIVCLSKSGNIRAMLPDDFTSRPIQVGETVIESVVSRNQKDMILLIDSKSEYLYLPRDEFPVLGRKAGGVKTSMKDTESIKMVIMNSQSPSAFFAFGMDSSDGQTYTLFRSVTNFIQTKRTNKPKTMIDNMEHYNIKSGYVFVLKEKTEIILVGNTDLTSIPSRHINDTGIPRRTSFLMKSILVYQ